MSSSAYDEFLNLPHHVSSDLPHMSMQNRAAQFASFAALTGFESIIKETCRQTAHRIELDESAKEALDKKLQRLLQVLHVHPQISITFFKPDEKKDGGAYICITGTIKKIDGYGENLIMTDGTQIPISEITSLQGDLLNDEIWG